MKLLALLLAVVLGLLLLGGALPMGSRAADDDDDTIMLEERKFVEVVSFDVPVGMLDRGPLDGAYGAAVVDVKIGRKVEGAMIITVIDRPALAVFVGLGMPDKDRKKVTQDLRMAFETTDDKVYLQPLAAGGGNALLFHSPDDIDHDSVRRVALYRAAKAKWAK